MKNFRIKALIIALVFTTFGAFWILLTDNLFLSTFKNAELITEYQTYKGWFYVAVTSFLIYLLSAKYFRNTNEIKRINTYLANVFDTVNEAIFIEDAKTGKIIDVNRMACTLYGYTKQEILTMDIGQLSAPYSPYTQSDAIEWLEKAKNGSPRIKEWVALHKSGREFWVEANVKHGFIDKEERYFVTVRNIEDRRKAEKDLSNMFNLSRDLMCLARISEMRFTRVNPAFINTLGYSEETLIGSSFLEFIHEDDKQKSIDLVEHELAKGKDVFRFENRYRCNDGTYRWLSWASHPLPKEDMIYAVARDVTERRKIEEELRKHRENLEQLVYERTHELEQKNLELREKNNELEHFNNLFVGREFRINELKQEISRLKENTK